MRAAAAIIGPVALLALCIGAVCTARAQVALPVLPCMGGEPNPTFAEIGDTPNVVVLREEDIKGWRRPHCAEFGPLNSNLLIATAGRFREDGGIDAIAARLARISELTKTRYYSVRSEEWRNLFLESHALGDSGTTPRPDFTTDDIRPGRILRFWQEENSLLSGLVYRLEIRERSADRLVYAIVNEGAAKAMFLTASGPGEFRQVYEIEREAGDVWRYYGFVDARVSSGPFNLSSRSFQFRSVAYYRHIAGYPTELDFRRAL